MNKVFEFINGLVAQVRAFWKKVNDKTGLLDKAYAVTKTEAFIALAPIALLVLAVFAFPAMVTSAINLGSLICISAMASMWYELDRETEKSVFSVLSALWAAIVVSTFASASPILGMLAMTLLLISALADMSAVAIAEGRGNLWKPFITFHKNTPAVQV